MKTNTLFALSVVLFGTAVAASAGTSWSVSIGVGAPAYYPAPVVVAPPPCPPRAVIVAPPAYYYYPPRPVCPPPRYVAPCYVPPRYAYPHHSHGRHHHRYAPSYGRGYGHR